MGGLGCSGCRSSGDRPLQFSNLAFLLEALLLPVEKLPAKTILICRNKIR
jgi:hypothetical protein